VRSREAEVADLWGRLEAQQPQTPDQVLQLPVLSRHVAGCSRAGMLWSGAGELPWRLPGGAAAVAAGSMRPKFYCGNQAMAVQKSMFCQACWCFDTPAASRPMALHAAVHAMMPAAGATVQPSCRLFGVQFAADALAAALQRVAALSGQLDALRGGASCGFM
jgi:hypothetical protein